jgi:two-component system cell cycle response regulator
MARSAQNQQVVLIVEDSHTQAVLLEQLLGENGFAPYIVSSATSAYKWLSENKPTIIISDILMPDIDGYEFCHSVKHNPDTHHIPVLLLTCLSEPEDIVRGLESGADHFVTKPFDDEMLLTQLNNILLNKDLRDHPASQEGVEIFFGGKHHVINSERSQILDLLLSTYESSLQQKRQLEKINQQLKDALSTIKKRNDEIAELVIRDPLTKIFNRGYFNDTFPGVIKNALRHEKPLALIMCDIDNFKNINDECGHQAGDIVLRQVAQCLDDRLREGSDWIARFGGDEFVLVLSETDGAGAGELAESLRQLVAEITLEFGACRLPLTASFGVAIFSAANAAVTTMNEMVAVADRCLYQAKEQGKNCCSCEQVVK